MTKLEFEEMDWKVNHTYPPKQMVRAKIPQGWIVRETNNDGGIGLLFVPDPKHEWK